MNEIRMYVERLFQGKVLTDEIIELKEEIYGNLVARYEDYVASGLSPENALAKTKASMTSVDDVLDAKAAEQAASEAAAAQPEPAPVAQSVPGAPVNPAGAVTAAGVGAGAVAPAQQPKKRWPVVVIVIVAIVVALGAGGLIVFEAFDDAWDRDDAGHVSSNQGGVSIDDGEGNSVNIGKDGVSIQASPDGDGIVVGSDGSIRVDGDLLNDDVIKAVVNGNPDDLRPYANTDLADATKVQELINALPMGSYAKDLDVTKGNGVLSYAYQVPDSLEDDSVDAALVSNATALMSAIPGATEVQISVSDDVFDPADPDYYVFKLGDLENAYGTKLSADLFVGDGWTATIKRDHLYKNDFIDQQVDIAENNGR